MYRCLHSTAPTYLTDSLRRTADVDGRRRLRSSESDKFFVASTNRSTLGDRAFPVAALRAWNGFLSQSRFVSVDVLSGSEDSLPDEFSVTYLVPSKKYCHEVSKSAVSFLD